MTKFADPKAPTYAEWCDHRATLSEKDDVLFISHETPEFDNAGYLLTCYVAETSIDGAVLTADDFDGVELSEDLSGEEVATAVANAFEDDLPEVESQGETETGFHVNGAEFTFEVDDDEITIEFEGE